MSRLLRTLACFVMAVAMLSTGFVASAHSSVAVAEQGGFHVEKADDMACSDCGAHRLRGCAQSCAASVWPVEPDPAAPQRAVLIEHPPARPAVLRGLLAEPPLTPPIA